MTITRTSYRKLVSNLRFIRFLIDEQRDYLNNDGCLHVDVERDTMHLMLDVLRGTKITKWLPMDVYGFFRDIGLGHHFLYGDTLNLQLSTLSKLKGFLTRYTYRDQCATMTEGLPSSTQCETLSIYEMTGDKFCAENGEQTLRVIVTFHIDGSVCDVDIIHIENDVGGVNPVPSE